MKVTSLPTRTPKAIVARLNREIVQVLNQPEVRDRLLAMSTVPVGNASQAFGAFVRAERDKWAKVVREAEIKIE